MTDLPIYLFCQDIVTLLASVLTVVLIAMYSLSELIMDHQMRDVAVDFVLSSCSFSVSTPILHFNFS